MGYTPPTLYVNKIAGGWSLTPPDNTTTDDLTIYPNTVDTRSNIKIEGAGGVKIDLSAGTYFYLYNNGTIFQQHYTTGTDSIIESTVNNYNLFFKTTGSGVLKFGTYTAGAATDSTGYITILDAAGNTRKLMVQA